MTENPTIQTAINHALAAASLATFDPARDGQFAVVPSDFKLVSLEPFQKHPTRLVKQHTFEDTTSLAAYLKRWADECTMVSVSSQDSTITASIDYHDPNFADPSWGLHSARFKAQLHPTIKAWLAVEGRTMSQIQFGRFLEDRAQDVVQPDAASVMEMVMTFDAIKRVTFRSSQRLQDGRRQFLYSEENEAKGSTTLPDHFVIHAPIYKGMDARNVKIMVRYDISEGALTFKVELHNKEQVLLDAFEECVADLVRALDGTPIISEQPFYRVISD